MSDAVVSIGIPGLFAAFSLLWWEVRQLRKSKHSNAQVIQWLVICVAILAQRAGIELPKIVKDE